LDYLELYGCVCLQQLIDAVARQDVNKSVLVLSHCNSANMEQVSAPFSQSDWRTALHIAAFLGNVIILQLLLWVCCLFVAILFSRFCEISHQI